MKYPTLRKVMLTTMALVASLALSAQAGGPSLSAAKQQQGKRTGAKHFPFTAQKAGGAQHSPLDFIYQLDDGTAEDAIGLTAGGDIISLNEFAVVPGSETINSVEIAWGTPAFFDPGLDGLPYTVAIWSDPNGDGNPTDAVLLTTASGVVADQGTDTFISTNIGATITTSNFFVGFLIGHSAGQFPSAFDESNPIFNRSYVAGGASGDIENLNNNDIPVAPIEAFGLFGNWLIRATATGEGTPTPTPTPPPPGALWYNGDFNGEATGNGLANEENTGLGAGQFAFVYDDFNVNDAGGWDVDSVFSNNLENTGVTGATFEIRSGVSSGNGGTLIASGTTVTPVVTATGRSGFGFTEFMIEITGLSVHLDPGTYHLSVWPIGDLTGRSFNSTTAGENCIGTPCGDDDNAFWDSNFFGVDFGPTQDQCSPPNECIDFSMGVNGQVSGGGGITLTATVKHHKGNSRVQLSWSPADGGDVNVLRNGTIKFTTADDGSATNNAGTRTGTVTYQVCETDTGVCSNVVEVTLR